MEPDTADMSLKAHLIRPAAGTPPSSARSAGPLRGIQPAKTGAAIKPTPTRTAFQTKITRIIDDPRKFLKANSALPQVAQRLPGPPFRVPKRPRRSHPKNSNY